VTPPWSCTASSALRASREHTEAPRIGGTFLRRSSQAVEFAARKRFDLASWAVSAAKFRLERTHHISHIINNKVPSR